MKINFNFFSNFSLFGSFVGIGVILGIIRLLGIDMGIDLVIFFEVSFGWLLIFLAIKIKENWARIKFFKPFSFVDGYYFSSIQNKKPGDWTDIFRKSIKLIFKILLDTIRLIKKIIFSRWALLITFILGIIFDTFFLYFVSDLITLPLTVLWFIIIWVYALKSKVSFLGGTILFVLCPILMLAQKEIGAEKSAIWAFVFLVAGAIQMFFEEDK